MSKKRKVLIILVSIALAATLGFIWINSCLSQETSASESGGVYETIKPTLDAVFGEDKVSHNTVRKSAHFFEFFMLGLEISALYYLVHGVKKEKIAEVISAGLFVAVIDESLQILSNRGPMVIDVLIDYSGYLLAVGLTCLGIFVLHKIRKRKAEK